MRKAGGGAGPPMEKARQAPAGEWNCYFQPVASWHQDQGPAPRDQFAGGQHPPSGWESAEQQRQKPLDVVVPQPERPS